MQNKIVSKVQSLVLPILNELNLELYDLEFIKEGNDYFLRVYIDNANGRVNINECETVSRRLSKILDDEDFIQDSYILEVCSPGIERTLKTDAHFQKYIGHEIKINLYKPYQSHKNYEGVLVSIDDDNIELAGNLLLPRALVSKCKLKSKGEDSIA